MSIKTQSTATIVEKIWLILFFVAAGSLVIVVFPPWKPLLKGVEDYLGRIAMMVFFGLLLLLASKTRRLEKFRPMVFGFLVLAVAVTLDWVFGIFSIEYLGLRANTPVEWSMAKLNEFGVVASVIIVFTLCSRTGLGSIYLQRGNLRLGLLIGGACFVVFVLGGIPISTLLFNGKDLSLARVLPWTPWLLIYVLANAAMEELMFRGLFLRKLEPHLGKFLSNFTVAVVFTLIHYAVTYSSSQLIFLAITFPLALILGYLAQKTNALWASILLHAGMDIPLMIGIFSNL